MENEEIKNIFVRYLAGTATAEERAWVESWYQQFEEAPVEPFSPVQLDRLEAETFRFPETPHFSRTRRFRVFFPWAAAVVLVCLAVALLLWTQSQPTINLAHVSGTGDFSPAPSQVALTVGDRTVALDGDKKGITFLSGSIHYIEGDVVGSATGKADAAEVQQYKLTTSKGGQYQVVLPDGTKVWLNSESALSYPSTFSANARVVELHGEAYFEVAHRVGKDANDWPFQVKTPFQLVEVLGTRFNINSYDNEGIIKTTLLEGSIQVRLAAEEKTGIPYLLQPRQQSILTKSSHQLRIHEVDPAVDIAWKNGEFTFDNMPLGMIMREIARWYDVEITYEDEQLKRESFGGTISRQSQISDVLKMLALTETVRFFIDERERRIMVRR